MSNLVSYDNVLQKAYQFTGRLKILQTLQGLLL